MIQKYYDIQIQEDKIDFQIVGNFTTETDVTFYPRGGGRSLNLPPKILNNLDKYEVKEWRTELVDKLAYFDDCQNEECKRWPCKVDMKDRWNGWAVPHFTLEVTKEIIETMHCEITSITDDKISIEEPTNRDEHFIYKLNSGLWVFDGFCWYIQ